MTTQISILEQFAGVLVPELKSVSGRFAPSIEAEIDSDGLTIYANEYITTLIDGRRPTSSGAKKGNPTLQQILLDWIESKGIQPREKTMTTIQLSWAMSKSMHQKGDLLWQRGGKNNRFGAIITKNRIDNLMNLLSDSYYSDLFKTY